MSLLKSAFNALLKPAEDPRQSAVYTYERQRALLIKVRSLLTDLAATKQQLTRKTAVFQTSSSQLHAQARQAVASGDETGARLLLQRQKMAEAEQQTFQTQLTDLQQEEQRLLLVENHLVNQIEAYVARQEAAATRYNTAESQANINKGLQKLFNDLAELDQMLELTEVKTAQLEARASVLEVDFENEVWLATAVADYQLTAVDINEKVEEELSRLKTLVCSNTDNKTDFD